MKLVKLLITIMIPFLAGAIGSIATIPSIPTWYAALDKPFLNPPNFIFGPVWTTLYLLMGIGLYLVWTSKTIQGKRSAYTAFAVQLFLNAAWSLVFFGLHQLVFSVVVVVGLVFSIFVTIILFYRISKPAAYILVPYLLWTCFATYLTIGVAVLN